MQDAFSISPYDGDDDLIEALRRDGKPRLRVYQPDQVMVVLGRGSKPETELYLDACNRDRVSVLRRRGGGCAVVLDRGNVIVSVTKEARGIGGNQRHFAELSDWLIAALDHLGFPGIRQDGISDLIINNRKIAGACMVRKKDLLFYSASLLVRADVSLMERYLKHPPREPEYRKGRRHSEFVTNLSTAFDSAEPESLVNSLQMTLRLEGGPLSRA